MTTPRRFYDVVLLGTSLGTLCAGALLAHRGFRVLCVRHDERARVYRHDDLELLRAPAALTCLDTPAFRAVSSELGLGPTLRRKLRVHDPVFQVALPGQRLDVWSDLPTRLDELSREFPEIRRAILEFHERVDKARTGMDPAFAADVMWPPEGFFERRAVMRAISTAPWVFKPDLADPLADLPARHPFRTFVRAGVQFLSRQDADSLTAGALLRLFGRLASSSAHLEGGPDALAELLLTKITQYGGEVLPREQVERVIIERKSVRGVHLLGNDERVGCDHLVTGFDTGTTLRLTDVEQDDLPDDVELDRAVTAYVYTVNFVLNAHGVPSGMGARVFHVLSHERPLAEENLLAIEALPGDAKGRVVLAASCLLPRAGVDEGHGYLRHQRERVRASLRTLVPFLDEHLLAVDSPHDGLPYQDRVNNTTAVPAGRRADVPEPMVPIHAARREGFLKLWARGTVGPFKGLLFTGSDVCPALGEEGELLAGITAARRITRKYGTRERMRRELMWSKPES